MGHALLTKLCWSSFTGDAQQPLRPGWPGQLCKAHIGMHTMAQGVCSIPLSMGMHSSNRDQASQNTGGWECNSNKVHFLCRRSEDAVLERFVHVFWERGLSTSTEANQLERAEYSLSELGSKYWGNAGSTRWLSDYAGAREGNGTCLLQLLSS